MRILVGPSKRGFYFLNHCVYTHSIDGIVFYVGHGTPTRPYSSGVTNRNKIWMDTVRKNNYFDVDIIGWYESKAEAILKERELIALYKPAANPPRKHNFRQYRNGDLSYRDLTTGTAA